MEAAWLGHARPLARDTLSSDADAHGRDGAAFVTEHVAVIGFERDLTLTIETPLQAPRRAL